MNNKSNTLSFESFLGSPEAAPDARELRERIQEQFKGTSAFEEGRGYQNVSASEVLAAFGYEVITVDDFSEEELAKIRELVRDSQQSLYGVDRGAITSNRPIYKNHQMARKGDTIIFFTDLGSLNSAGHVGWSQLKMTGGIYTIHPMNHDNSTFEMIHLLSMYEAASKIAKDKRADVESVVSE